MFYESSEKCDKAFRFGDVLNGFAIATPSIQNPPLSNNCTYQIEVSMHSFYVILSPCCSISDKVLSLAPLLELDNRFFKNSYFKEDMTRLNRKMEAKNSIPAGRWNNMDPDEKAAKEQQGLMYAFLEFFIYKKNGLFTPYPINQKGENIETRCYMIDFRTIFQIKCDKVIAPKDTPLKCKCLQLTVETRNLLRDKLVFYFSRIPNEDKVLMS